jgi:hypothetical protein
MLYLMQCDISSDEEPGEGINNARPYLHLH